LDSINSGFRLLRNDKNIISSISVTDIVFDDYLRKWNHRAIPKFGFFSMFCNARQTAIPDVFFR